MKHCHRAVSNYRSLQLCSSYYRNKNNIKEPKINKASGMFNSKLFSNVYKTENK